MTARNLTASAMIFIIILLSFFKLEGFSNPISGTVKEIEENNFIDTIAIDLLDPGKDNKWKVTVSYPDLKSQSGSSQSEQKPKNQILSTDGRSIFEAHRKMYLISSKTLLYNHTSWILLGDAAARSGISECLDFEIRDLERGWGTNIGLIKDTSAGYLLQQLSQNNEPVESLITGIREMSDYLSLSNKVSLLDVFRDLDDRATAFCMPYFTTEGADNKDVNNISAKNNVVCGGLAVIKDGRLYCYLNKIQSRGVNWITGRIKTLSLLVKDSSNEDVSLELLKENSEIRTMIDNSIPSAKIKIKVSSQIDELPPNIGELSDEYVKVLAEEEEKCIKSEAEAIIAFAQKNNADIFGLQDEFYHQHPVKWKKIEDNWYSLFPEMKIAVEVESKILRSGNFRKGILESR